MALLNQNKAVTHRRHCKSHKDSIDFSNIGGLSHHLTTLRDIIIFPLLHSNVFSYFNIKPPRGVLFYGPPGTGKTLVAGALCTEINREGLGKVAFFQRKGADILDKWVGESEKKLRELFDKATKNRPSIIFFDELDGLAPVRSDRNDHIHCSVVATLLSLMDGLENQDGVIIIGATNRIESIDPALRRPGRFDKELYFPLPTTEARKEILQVHTQSWKSKPTSVFLSYLAKHTAGFCGSDLQALCSEAVLCSMKRNYPDICNIGNRLKIDANSLKVEQCDFLDARLNLLPSSMKCGSKMRNLTTIIKPLLNRQLMQIMKYIRTLWPHFLKEAFKYSLGSKRYAGRIVLVGSHMQGLDTHLVPAVLQNFEHLPLEVYNSQRLFDKKIGNVQLINFPCVLLMSRVDEWWNFIEYCEQMALVNSLEELHAGLPILVIATCSRELPEKLQEFFFNNSSILINIEDPTEKEREQFLAPLFFDEKIYSLYSCSEEMMRKKFGNKVDDDYEEPKIVAPKYKLRKTTRRLNNIICKNHHTETPGAGDDVRRKRKLQSSSQSLLRKRIKLCEEKYAVPIDISDSSEEINQNKNGKITENHFNLGCTKSRQYFMRVLSDLLHQRTAQCQAHNNFSLKSFVFNEDNTDSKGEVSSDGEIISLPSSVHLDLETKDENMKQIYDMWKRVSKETSRNMTIAQLELLYDVISVCISINKYSFGVLIESLEDTFKRIEMSNHFKKA